MMNKEFRDYFTDLAFSKDFEGNTIFRSGSSSYYIIPDKKKEKELRSCIKRFYLIAGIAWLVGWTIAGVLFGEEYCPVGGFVGLPIAGLWFHYKTKKLLKGLKKKSWDEPKS